MKRNNKKGFTIVELVIVIAVIAILSAVLIPTFSGIVKKARLSTDQQAVRQMNTALIAEKHLNDDMNIFDAFEILEDAGMSAKNYKALSSGMRFFWDSEINRVLIVDDSTNKAVYPEDCKGRTNNGNWQSLTMEIKKEQPKADAYDGSAVTVTNGNQLAYVLDKISDGDNKVSEIKLPEKGVDMMGAALDLNVSSDLTISGGTIKNATTVDANKTHVGGKDGLDGFYNAALFPSVASGKTLTLSNVTFEDVNIKDINGSNVAILVGHNAGTVKLDNVTIKNSSVIGHHNVGALIGNFEAGKLIIGSDGVKIENVNVLSVGGRVGKLFGYAASSLTESTESTGTITLTNVISSIYECEANTGSYNGTTLGVADGKITSTEVESSGDVTTTARIYFENYLIGNYDTDGNYHKYSTVIANTSFYNAIKNLVTA